MVNTIINDPVFWSFFLTTSTAFIFGIVKVLAKSKCKNCSFCGCRIERDVELEEHLDELELQKKESSI
jgi:hypothetical protein